jgi:hypothetical protein
MCLFPDPENESACEQRLAIAFRNEHGHCVPVRDGSLEEVQLRDDFGGKRIANRIVLSPELLGLPIAVEEFHWPPGDDLELQMVPAAVPRIEHLPIGTSAGGWNRHPKIGCLPDGLPYLFGQSSGLTRDRRGLAPHRERAQVVPQPQVFALPCP